MNVKKILGVIATLLLLQMAGFCGDIIEFDGVKYNCGIVEDASGVSLSKRINTKEVLCLTFPHTVAGLPVKEIRLEIYMCGKNSSIKIPDGVESVTLEDVPTEFDEEIPFRISLPKSIRKLDIHGPRYGGYGYSVTFGDGDSYAFSNNLQFFKCYGIKFKQHLCLPASLDRWSWYTKFEHCRFENGITFEYPREEIPDMESCTIKGKVKFPSTLKSLCGLDHVNIKDAEFEIPDSVKTVKFDRNEFAYYSASLKTQLRLRQLGYTDGFGR